MTRTRVIGVALAVAAAVFCTAFAAVQLALPPQGQGAADGRDFGYVYSGAKSASVDFSTATMAGDALVLFGSSELSTPPSLVPQVPASTFGMSDCGLDLAYVGEAYDQSLWQAIAAGAYAPRLGTRKVAVVVSPVWFADGGLDPDLFRTRFSYSLYRGFMANPALSDETRRAVQDRLRAFGVDEAVVRAGAAAGGAGAASPVEVANDAVFATMDDLKLRADLRAVRQMGFEHPTGAGQGIDFDALRDGALADAAERSHNDWGFDDASYDAAVAAGRDAIRGALAGETFSDEAEFGDFALFLRVCEESGLQPLVVLSPLSGDYYDWVGVDAATRAASYDRIRAVAQDHGAAVADLSDREYERYFLHDQVHFGWLGWLDVEEAIYAFARPEASAAQEGGAGWEGER